MREALPKSPRGVALEPIDELTNRKRWRSVNEHMQVVGLDGEMLDANLKFFGFLASKSVTSFASLHWQFLGAVAVRYERDRTSLRPARVELRRWG